MAKSKRERDTVKEVRRLGGELLSSRDHINNLPLLLSYISLSSPPQHVLESLLSLQSFFTTVLPHLPSPSSSKSPNDPDSIYSTWLRAKFDDFVRSMIRVVVSPQSQEPLREIVLDAIMDFVRLGNVGRFNSSIYHRLLHTIIVQSTAPVEFVADLLASKYLNYIDVRYFTYICLEKLCRTFKADNTFGDKTRMADSDNDGLSRTSTEVLIHKIHYVISHIPQEGPGEKSEYEMWSGSGDHKKNSDLPKDDTKQLKTNKHSINVLSAATISKKMKLKFTKAWISFLRLPLTSDVYKEVLVTLHQAVIPYFSNPIMLSDFLTRSYDIGGVVSVMALSSLFILMTQHGLEYPDFYEKLYELLVPSIFMAKHRAKFFELLDSCLKSPLLPAYLAAAFAKRLSRLALTTPPSGALIIIALIHNLLRRHPSINCLVHREDVYENAKNDSKAEEIAESADDTVSGTTMSSRKPGIDHFNNKESKPIKSNAMGSSLWEIDTLRHHYCQPVSRFVMSLVNDLTVRAKTTEMNVKDFSSGSYATIFGDEIRRRIKQVPVAFYKATPTSLFSESEFAGWSFKYEESNETTSEVGERNSLNMFEENDQIHVKRQRTECS